jgi:LemA protein
MIYLAIIALVLIVIYLVMIYNSLVSKRNDVDYAFGGMDTMLKKRYDLLPNLVAIVKTYMEHEKSTLVEIAELRSRREAPELKQQEKEELDTKVETAMSRVMLSVENYPNLKANTNFLKLQAAWNECEEQIAASRRAYNSAVTEYNTAFEQFPGSQFAGTLRYEKKKVFEIPELERANISAKDLFAGK